MSCVHRVLRRVGAPSDRVDPYETWLAVVLSQLAGCRHLLYTRAGMLLGFRVGWHVYTAAGVYVGSFREPTEEVPSAPIFAAGGDYLGELDPDDRERVAVDLSRRHLRRPPASPLPDLPEAAIRLYSVRPPLLPRTGWIDLPERLAADDPCAWETAPDTVAS